MSFLQYNEDFFNEFHNSVTNNIKNFWFVAICRYLHILINNVTSYGIFGHIFVQNYIYCLATHCAPLLRGRIKAKKTKLKPISRE